MKKNCRVVRGKGCTCRGLEIKGFRLAPAGGGKGAGDQRSSIGASSPGGNGIRGGSRIVRKGSILVRAAEKKKTSFHGLKRRERKSRMFYCVSHVSCFSKKRREASNRDRSHVKSSLFSGRGGERRRCHGSSGGREAGGKGRTQRVTRTGDVRPPRKGEGGTAPVVQTGGGGVSIEMSNGKGLSSRTADDDRWGRGIWNTAGKVTNREG